MSSDLAIAAATALPVSADLEKGFGDTPECVAETIRAAALTGLAGCSIEDHTGHHDDPILGFNLALERIEATAQTCPRPTLGFRADGPRREFALGPP